MKVRVELVRIDADGTEHRHDVWKLNAQNWRRKRSV